MNNEELKQLVQDVREIKLAVTGDTSLGIPGLGKRVTMLENWKNQITFKIAFSSGVGAALVFGAKAGIEYLINHK